MKVRILKVDTNEEVNASIVKGDPIKLPSVTDGWRFNFNRQAKKGNSQAYVLITEETPDIIEGCLIYKMRDEIEPYLAFIEIAPHNRGRQKKYDKVAGCLIAYASRLSFILAEGPYKGWLAFEVSEEKKENQLKLMTIYSTKYGAIRLAETNTMLIKPEDGEKLIEEYITLQT